MKKKTKKFNNKNKEMELLYAAAHEAGMKAGNSHNPTPMIIETHSNPLDDSSPVIERWKIGQGVCGFAWIKISPTNCKFVKYLKEAKIGRKDEYEGGYKIRVPYFNQSYERKFKYAEAFAEVIRKNGFKRTYAYGRID